MLLEKNKNLLNLKYQQKIKDDLSLVYNIRLNELREDLKNDNTNKDLSEDFKDFYQQALISKDLDQYSSLGWYWIQSIEKLIYLLYLHHLFDKKQTNIAAEEELFNFWEDSEYTESFLKIFNLTNNILETSLFHLELFANQIMTSFVLHIDFSINIENKRYFPIPELGNSKYRIRVPDGSFEIPLSKEIFVTIKNKKIFINKKEYKINQNQVSREDLSILSSSKEIDKKISTLNKNIQLALDIIKKSSPELHHTLMNFTQRIIPINEKNIVSYSMQILPGYSSINIYERDFLDLMDDLLHENGHHYMNIFLNIDDLIIEDDEKIYYLPWRDSLRPIRGIYHAYFTFYWAFKLYYSLYENLHLLQNIYPFSQVEIKKIYKRALEEWYMLKMSEENLKLSYSEGKILKEGYKLITIISNDLDRYSAKILILSQTLEKIDKVMSHNLNEFIQELKEKFSLYSLE